MFYVTSVAAKGEWLFVRQAALFKLHNDKNQNEKQETKGGSIDTSFSSSLSHRKWEDTKD